MISFRILLILAATVTGSSPLSAAIASLSIDSEPGDSVGQGNDYLLDYDSGKGSTIFANIVQTISGAPSHITFSLQNPTNGGATDSASMRVSSHETGAPLAVGTYMDAGRVALPGSGDPVFDLAFQGRGNNTHTASFTISDIAFSGTGPLIQLDRFAATFQQLGTGASGGLTGSISFSSSAVPETSPVVPGAIALAVIGVLTQRRRRVGKHAAARLD